MTAPCGCAVAVSDYGVAGVVTRCQTAQQLYDDLASVAHLRGSVTYMAARGAYTHHRFAATDWAREQRPSTDAEGTD